MSYPHQNGLDAVMREKMRQVSGQGIDDRNRLAPVPNPHVDMHAEGLNPAGKPLHLLDELRIALDRRHRRVSPVTDRVSPGAGQQDTALRRHPLEFA